MRKILKNFAGKDIALAVVAVAFIVASVWMELTIPEYMSEITVLVQTPGSTMRDILIAGGKMLLYAFGSLVATVIISVCAAKLAMTLGTTLRARLFHKVQSFSMEEIGHFPRRQPS
jgi:ATP-binding cassette subfamily B protein